MKEYKVMAYFSKVYTPRSYKRKIVNTIQEATDLLAQAKLYYAEYPYLEKVVIESREVTEWEEM